MSFETSCWKGGESEQIAGLEIGSEENLEL